MQYETILPNTCGLNIKAWQSSSWSMPNSTQTKGGDIHLWRTESDSSGKGWGSMMYLTRPEIKRGWLPAPIRASQTNSIVCSTHWTGLPFSIRADIHTHTKVSATKYKGDNTIMSRDKSATTLLSIITHQEQPGVRNVYNCNDISYSTPIILIYTLQCVYYYTTILPCPPLSTIFPIPFLPLLFFLFTFPPSLSSAPSSLPTAAHWADSSVTDPDSDNWACHFQAGLCVWGAAGDRKSVV